MKGRQARPIRAAWGGVMYIRSILNETCAGIRGLLPFHGFVAAYTAIVLGFSWSLGKLDATAHGQYFDRLGGLYLITLPVVVLLCSFVVLVVKTNDWPARRSILARRLEPVAVGRLLSGFLALAAFIVFMGSFTTFKTLMPELMGGFTHDAIQADIDRALHFGHEPGNVLFRLLDAPYVREAIEWNYSVLWSLIGFIPVYFIATSARGDRLRLRYLLTTVATWAAIGSVLACLFLSAGPAFYGAVTGDAVRFAPLNAFLGQSASSPAAAFQAYLWKSYSTGTASLGTGISAFPSMHVGLAMMQALFLREISRPAGLVGFGYVALVIASSVYLGWHYAIDGYVSVLVALGIHAGIRRLFLRHEAKRAAVPGPAAAEA